MADNTIRGLFAPIAHFFRSPVGATLLGGALGGLTQGQGLQDLAYLAEQKRKAQEQAEQHTFWDAMQSRQPGQALPPFPSSMTPAERLLVMKIDNPTYKNIGGQLIEFAPGQSPRLLQGFTPPAKPATSLNALAAAYAQHPDDPTAKENYLRALSLAQGQKQYESELRFRREQELEKWKQTQQLGPYAAGAAGGAVVPQDATKDESAIAGLPPEEQSTIKALTEYRAQLPTGAALRSPLWQARFTRAMQYDPTFDVKKYNQRQKVMNDYAVGPTAQNRKNLNTVMGHLGDLKRSADALSQYSDLWVATHTTNWLKNMLSEQSGNPNVLEFKANADAVANELEAVFRGNRSALAGIREWRKNLSTSKSPEELNGVIKKFADLIDSRMEALKSPWKVAFDTDPPFDLLEAEPRAIFDAIINDQPLPPRSYSTAPLPAHGPSKSVDDYYSPYGK